MEFSAVSFQQCSPTVTVNECVVEQLMRSDKRLACEMKVPSFRMHMEYLQYLHMYGILIYL